ncbi:MAG: SixA phosphatase family protein [Acidimicrobiales bacterium]
MKRVWILRHAKAGPHSADDHGRTLVERGRRQCAGIADQLSKKMGPGGFPPLVISSSAQRAQLTAQLVVEALGAPTTIEVDKQMYQADADDIVVRLQALDDEIDSVVVVGHNPALSELAVLLTADDDDKGRSKVRDGLPTAGLVIFGFDVSRWGNVCAHGGRVEAMYVPERR